MVAESVIAKYLGQGVPTGGGHALFIHGGWGEGKTYFWERKVVPLLGKRPVYTMSMFGVSSEDGFKSKLNSAIISQKMGVEKSGKVQQSIKVLAKSAWGIFSAKTGVNISVDVDLTDFAKENEIFCFDDFERVGKEFDIRIAFGVFSKLIEAKKCHVVVIVNESEIGDWKDDYQKFKEKIGSRVYKIETDKQVIVDQISFEVTQKHPRLKNTISLLAEIVRIAEVSNIRTIYRCFNVAVDLESEVDKQLGESALRFLVSVVCEEAEGRKPVDFSFYQFEPFAFAIKGAGGVDSEKQHSYWKRHFGANVNYRCYKFVYDYLRKGMIDKKAAQLEVDPPEDKRVGLAAMIHKVEKQDHLFMANEAQNTELRAELIEHMDKDQHASMGHLLRAISYVEGLDMMMGLRQQKSYALKVGELIDRAAKQTNLLELIEVHNRPFLIRIENESVRKQVFEKIASAIREIKREKILASVCNYEAGVIRKIGRGEGVLFELLPEMILQIDSNENRGGKDEYIYLEAVSKILKETPDVQVAGKTKKLKSFAVYIKGRIKNSKDRMEKWRLTYLLRELE